MNPKKSLVYDGGFHQEATSNGISSHCCRQQAGSHNPGFQRACGLLLLIPDFHEHNICICNISLNNRAKAVTQPFKRINKIIAMAKVQFFFVHVQASPRVVHLTLSFSVGTFFFSSIFSGRVSRGQPTTGENLLWRAESSRPDRMEAAADRKPCSSPAGAGNPTPPGFYSSCRSGWISAGGRGARTSLTFSGQRWQEGSVNGDGPHPELLIQETPGCWLSLDVNTILHEQPPRSMTPPIMSSFSPRPWAICQHLYLWNQSVGP